MELLFEFGLQLILWIFELLFTLVGEGLFDWGRGTTAARASLAKEKPNSGRAGKGKAAKPDPTEQDAGPVLTALAYAGFGALCGVVSLWIAPAHFLGSPLLRWANLIVSPLLAGYLVARWRAGNAPSDKPADFNADWINGALLAFALAATRLALTR